MPLGSSYLGQAATAGTQLVSVAAPAPSASDRVLRSVYDSADRQVFAIDAEGAATEYRHDGAGNLLLARQYKTALVSQQLSYIDSLSTQAGRPSRA